MNPFQSFGEANRNVARLGDFFAPHRSTLIDKQTHRNSLRSHLVHLAHDSIIVKAQLEETVLIDISTSVAKRREAHLGVSKHHGLAKRGD